MFSPLSKLSFTLAPLAAVGGLVFGLVADQRAGSMLLLFAAALLVALGLAAFAGTGADTPPDLLASATAASAPAVHDVPNPSAAIVRPSGWPMVAALGATLVAVGLAVNPAIFVTGLVAVLAGGIGWLGQAWREHPSYSPKLGARIADRVVRPIGLPLVVLILVGVAAVSFSRVLLAVPKNVAWPLALVAAVLILAGFWFVAERELPRNATYALAIVAALLVVATGIAGAISGEADHGGGHGGGDHGGAQMSPDNSHDLRLEGLRLHR